MDYIGPFAIAVSGGPDSMACLDFFRQGKKKVSAIFVHHNTEASDEGYEIVSRYCAKHSIHLDSQRIPYKNPKSNLENFWREERYKIFRCTPSVVVTCHHLDDCIEQMFINLNIRHKNGSIPYSNTNAIRPFRLTPKASLEKWCIKNKVPYMLDKSNEDLRFLRPRIRKILKEYQDTVGHSMRKLTIKWITEN